ncbi:sulfatase-like hydrolase/transferase [Desulfoluna spongiiphila]|uniref:Arylsulfatase n=1 Tax=Desulfoluna spongiiphila TaxID=419481 RepID=A0A1G5IS12_9BACT|nr:sulfatase-like hydrolase/transferase [Desulfoluna spongiiphila]SCY78419.1 arylsulfatase [Desulfoluna spongiiphila]
MRLARLLCLAVIALSMGSSACASGIVQDGEFNFVKAQHLEQWSEQDKQIDTKLAEIREKQGGKRPNILYILIDDVGFGEFGIPELNYVRGTQTPRINKLSDEGLSFMRMYTEPSCTPTRTAMMTGRHPVRTGLEEVKVALIGEGLPKNEVTIAEVLSKAGYATVHIGKWHMGDIKESYPHNQGFDFAAFPLNQQVQLSLMTEDAERSNAMTGYVKSSYTDKFALDKKFKPFGLVTGVEAYKGKDAHEVDMEAGEQWNQEKYNDMNLRYQRQTLEQLRSLAKQEKPFFLQYWPLIPLNFVRSDREQFNMQNGGTMVESMNQLDGWVGEILDELDKLGIADNTLVVLMGDNGPFLRGYQKITGMSDMIYRGGKADHLEGGVRVNAFARWPAAIKPDTLAGDMIHVSDLYTTFARLGGATKYIPTDRIIDGIDQTALLLEGEGNGRRDYVYIYEGVVLRSIVKQKFKMHMPAPGVPGAAAPVFDIARDPREMTPLIEAALWSGASFQDMLKRHMMGVKKYPHSKGGSDKPYEGIDNLRPETLDAVETFMSWH